MIIPFFASFSFSLSLPLPSCLLLFFRRRHFLEFSQQKQYTKDEEE